MTCVERPLRQPKMAVVHAKKEKQENDVCGALSSPAQEGGGTRQKRKSKKMTCAERPLYSCKRAAVHAKKEKARK